MSILRAKVGNGAQRILITGGCGFIGSNLASKLVSRGQQVIVFDSLARAGAQVNAEWLRAQYGDRVSIEIGDVRDIDAVRNVVATSTAVLHLAAQVAVTTSLDDPVGDFEVNTRGTLNVLEAVRECNPRAPVIFASTNKVYGKLLERSQIRLVDDHYAPANARLARGIAENTPLDFYSPYGCSKGAADQYVRDYARIYGLQTVVMRMSCIYGPRQFGTEDQGWIAHFLLQALEGQPITIYGDGYQVRDALYVEDAANAWIGALDHIATTRGRVFNLGGGPQNAVSLRQMMTFIAEMQDHAPDVHYDAWRPGDQPWYVSDIRSISEAINWSPRITLRDGLRALDGWLQERFVQAASAASLSEVRA